MRREGGLRSLRKGRFGTYRAAGRDADSLRNTLGQRDGAGGNRPPHSSKGNAQLKECSRGVDRAAFPPSHSSRQV